jgi:D-arabinose 1-dehydrogenase-like Zn-dependent alcohol dehydrogenase
MQSLVLTQDGLQLADTPRPALMPGSVRIEVRSVGICSTDIAIWKGEYDVKLPLVLGHEMFLVVDAGTAGTINLPSVGIGKSWG